MDDFHPARTCHLPHQAISQRNFEAHSISARSRFGLDEQFLVGVIQDGDTDVIVG